MVDIKGAITSGRGSPSCPRECGHLCNVPVQPLLIPIRRILVFVSEGENQSPIMMQKRMRLYSGMLSRSKFAFAKNSRSPRAGTAARKPSRWRYQIGRDKRSRPMRAARWPLPIMEPETWDSSNILPDSHRKGPSSISLLQNERKIPPRLWRLSLQFVSFVSDSL